jgi:hypothetical protein
MSAVYPLALEAVLAGDIDYLDGTINAQLIDSTYTYSAAHGNLSDVTAGARISDPVTLTGKDLAGGWALCDDLAFPDVPGGDTVAGVVIYLDTGDDTSSTLIAHLDRFADTAPISIDTDDAAITLHLLNNRLFKI